MYIKSKKRIAGLSSIRINDVEEILGVDICVGRNKHIEFFSNLDKKICRNCCLSVSPTTHCAYNILVPNKGYYLTPAFTICSSQNIKKPCRRPFMCPLCRVNDFRSKYDKFVKNIASNDIDINCLEFDVRQLDLTLDNPDYIINERNVVRKIINSDPCLFPGAFTIILPRIDEVSGRLEIQLNVLLARRTSSKTGRMNLYKAMSEIYSTSIDILNETRRLFISNLRLKSAGVKISTAIGCFRLTKEAI